MSLCISCTEIPIRWVDMDAYGHVNSATYFDFLTQARHDLLLKPFPDHEKFNFFLVDIQCTYQQPIIAPDTIIIEQTLKAIGTSSFEISSTIKSKTQDKICTQSLATLVTVDAATNQAKPIPLAIKKRLQASETHPRPSTYYQLPDSIKLLNTISFPMRWVDMDAFQHVNNARYFDYMVEARNLLFPRGNIENNACLFFLINTRANFRKMLHYPSDVIVKQYLIKQGGASTTFGYQFFESDSNTLCAEGEATLVTVDKSTQRPIRTPEFIQQYFTKKT